MLYRKAKIVATIGPACSDEKTMHALFNAGVDVARLNFSHGTHDIHAALIKLIRKLSVEIGKPITILQDLQGPKLRVGKLPEEGLNLKADEKVVLTPTTKNAIDNKDFIGETIIPMDVPNLARGVAPGKRILLDDGHLELEVVDVKDDSVFARVILGGQLFSNKGVNLPGAALDIPPFTEKDRADLEFGLQHDVDMIAISFVHQAEDINIVRNTIHQLAPAKASMPIIAKLERPEAIEHLHEIIHAADGVMVARGDLAVETSPSSVPIIQKQIIEMANKHAKVVITATQMLDSMIHNPRPTRAEASDVANAIFDGSDAVMLSGETASGDYPLESVKMMDAIVREAESNAAIWGHSIKNPEEASQDAAFAITRAANELANDRKASAIAIFTQSGKTALYMSKSRPQVPVMAFTPEVTTYQRLGMIWGAIPYLVPFASTVETMIASVDAAILSSTPIQAGEQVVVISGFPVGTLRPPNFALLHTVGE
jgi:pyruvate kinase